MVFCKNVTQMFPLVYQFVTHAYVAIFFYLFLYFFIFFYLLLSFFIFSICFKLSVSNFLSQSFCFKIQSPKLSRNKAYNVTIKSLIRALKKNWKTLPMYQDPSHGHGQGQDVAKARAKAKAEAKAEAKAKAKAKAEAKAMATQIMNT